MFRLMPSYQGIMQKYQSGGSQRGRLEELYPSIQNHQGFVNHKILVAEGWKDHVDD
jgi:hypothetical protein